MTDGTKGVPGASQLEVWYTSYMTRYTLTGKWKSGNGIEFDETFRTLIEAKAFAKGRLKKSPAIAEVTIRKTVTKEVRKHVIRRQG